MPGQDYLDIIYMKPSYITVCTKSVYAMEHGSNRKNKTMPELGGTPTHIENFKAETVEGWLSSAAKKRMKQAIDYLVYIAKPIKWYHVKYKKWRSTALTFVTLTLASSQVHTDQEIKNKLLHQFFIEARKKFHLKHYVWRAEKQENGNIHFHIITNSVIDARRLRDLWNRIQNKLGYIDRFCDSTGKRDANSTDIHSIRKVKKIKAYLSKYMAKNEYHIPGTDIKIEIEDKEDFKNLPDECKVFGRLWGCNYELSKLKSASEIVEGEIFEELMFLERLGKYKTIVHDYAKVLLVSIDELIKHKCWTLKSLLDNYISETLKPPEPVPIEPIHVYV